ncbi:uncharacterized protein LOC117783022 [Drosophila innubila]|uniref:uncharacterized protein LOC117783022 n=1 Tax=Drosophila innubila TaxID=198719 RepID=UPI00148E4593|nr:uncharacterized protein LOC117783022 [Drosophila innubila]
MKLIGLVILFLLCAATWADEVIEEVDVLQNIPDLNGSNDLQPLPISLSYEFNNRYILSVAFKVNWFEASAACALAGYTLAAIPTQSVQNRIYNGFGKSGFRSVLTEPVWTSGTNQANNFQWSWFATGKPFSYRNFLDPAAISTYRCMGVNAKTGYWSAEDCNAKRYFLCEKRCP